MGRLTVDGGREVTGFTDARQQRNGIWEVWVDYAYVIDQSIDTGVVTSSAWSRC